MKFIYRKKLLLLVFFISIKGLSQVGVNTTSPQAQLDIVASNNASPTNKDGLLVPRINTFPAINPTASQQGMLVYLTTTVGTNTPGFYYWDNPTSSWKTLGNSVLEIDPKVGSTNGNYIPKWNGTTLVDGSIYDDNTNVGIGLIPTKRFQVHTGVSSSSSIMVDHLSGALFNNTVTQRWQSFTATFNGELERVLLQFNNVSVASNRTISVYLGEGTSGTLLYTGSPVSVPVSAGVSGVSFNLTGVVVRTGIKYTIAIDDGSRWLYASGDEYAGGIGSNGAVNDYRFRLFAFQNNDGFSVSNVGVAINNYLLPKYDGVANQILQTDGAGNVLWTNPSSLSITETDPQVSSSTSNYIPKWNGTTLVDGQVFDNGTNVGVGTATPTDKVHVVGNIKIDGGKMPFINTGGSIAIGNNAGLNDDLTANGNVFIGESSGMNNITGTSNTAIGNNALQSNTRSSNTAIGNFSLKNNSNGNNNVAVGNYSGSSSTGSNNVMIGGGSGENATGSNNVFIGTEVGKDITFDNKLFIDNKSTPSPLIWGDFLGRFVDINGNLGIGTKTASEKLHIVNGNILADRGIDTFTSRKLTLGGAVPNNGSNFAQIDFINFDSNSTATDYTAASISSQNTNGADDGDLRFSTYNGTLSERMIITNDGNIGIGTITPTQAKLVVSGFTSNSVGTFGQFKNDGTGSVNSTGTPYAYSIYASNRIAASEFNAFSDARIKNIKGISNSKQDLEALRKIEITNYTLKDSISKGNNHYKKVIAQQVEKVYPQAVSKLTDVIPDIYKQADIKEGTIYLANNLKVGEKVKIIFSDKEEVVVVKTATTINFTIDSNKTGKVFVYGRQVDDFRSVDYEALSTLNISATQELLKKQEKLEAENKLQSEEIKNLNKRLDVIEKMLKK